MLVTRVFIWSLLGSLCFLATALIATASAPRNVLMIAIDDLGNVLDSSEPIRAKTPVLDRFAATGIRFDRAYCQIPLCNPSRASLLTGRRPDVTSVFDLERHFREQRADVITLPQLFRQNGWFTARVGKLYHYDVPAGIGTDGLDDKPSWNQVINPKGRDVSDEALITNPTPEKKISAALSWLAAEGNDEDQTDGMSTNAAIKLMEQNKDHPFFIGLGFFRPHTPFVAPKKYFDLYPLEEIHLPKAPSNDRADIPVAAFAHNNPTPNYGLDELTCRKALQAYLASVSFVDTQIGRALEALETLALKDNTVVVIWSDHGYHLGEHLGAWQKRTLFEEAARAPLLIREPNAKGNGRNCKRIVEFVDIYPTLAELFELVAPSDLSGRSLRPLLDNPEAPWNSEAISQILRPADARIPKPLMGRSIRTERWRYTEWDDARAGRELYDHREDPHEFTNLADKSELQPVISDLKSRLRKKASAGVPTTPFKSTKL